MSTNAVAFPLAPQIALSAREVSVTLGRTQALDRVSLDLPAGQWTAIVGMNGAGKSTLLAALAGLCKLDRGTVTLCGQSITTLSERERARRLAWLAQQGDADSEVTVRDIVRLGRLPHHGLFGAPDGHDETLVEAAMRDTECTCFAERRLSELSGGERQRVLLARALAVNAPVMLLDEPTTHLDAPHQRAVIRCIVALARAGTAVATVLHDPTLALAADRVVVMAHGKILLVGAPDDPALRTTLIDAFDHAFTIERLNLGGRGRWVSVTRLHD
ncbi:MAG: ABC transporter ATP-binding protein [Proteobacteria bacterium]|nr:ABC transporter ATP-binding protein [Burkholderiales bacterium]